MPESVDLYERGRRHEVPVSGNLHNAVTVSPDEITVSAPFLRALVAWALPSLLVRKGADTVISSARILDPCKWQATRPRLPGEEYMQSARKALIRVALLATIVATNCPRSSLCLRVSVVNGFLFCDEALLHVY